MTLPGVYCPRCGIENKPDAETCVSCGNDLRTWGQQPPVAQRPSGYGQPPAPPQQPYAQPYPGQPFQPPQKVPNYLPQSITLAVAGLCCWILPTAVAIPAIVFGSQVNTKLRLGDIPGALEASRNARIWCWLSFGLVIAFGIFLLTFMVLPFWLGA